MSQPRWMSIAGIVASLLAGVLIALAGSSGSVMIAGVPLFALCVAVAFLIQWLVFVPSFAARTEHYFDVAGSLTYLSMLGIVLLARGFSEPRSVLISVLVALWAVRLGSFLFRRISQAGADRRFTSIKTDFAQFLMAFTLQGTWVTLTLAAGLAAMTSARSLPLDWVAWLGVGLWLAGFVVEVVADNQKRRFRANPENESAFIASGLWAWSRHPNYFGEIVLWSGIAIIALPVLSGWQLATLISPFFVVVLLTRISGVPMLERRAERRWGEDPEYQAYRRSTPVLVLRPPAR